MTSLIKYINKNTILNFLNSRAFFVLGMLFIVSYIDPELGVFSYMFMLTGTWSAGGDLATAKGILAGAGTQTSGLSFGGTTGSYSNTTEEYNGTSWSSGGNLATAKQALAGAGT